MELVEDGVSPDGKPEDFRGATHLSVTASVTQSGTVCTKRRMLHWLGHAVALIVLIIVLATAGGCAAETDAAENFFENIIGDKMVLNFYSAIDERKATGLVPHILHDDWVGTFGVGCHSMGNHLFHLVESKHTMGLPELRTLITNSPNLELLQSEGSQENPPSGVTHDFTLVGSDSLVDRYTHKLKGGGIAHGIAVHRLAWTDRLVMPAYLVDALAKDSVGAKVKAIVDGAAEADKAAHPTAPGALHSNDSGITFVQGVLFESAEQAEAACLAEGFGRICDKAEASGFPNCAAGWFSEDKEAIPRTHNIGFWLEADQATEECAGKKGWNAVVKPTDESVDSWMDGATNDAGIYCCDNHVPIEEELKRFGKEELEAALARQEHASVLKNTFGASTWQIDQMLEPIRGDRRYQIIETHWHKPAADSWEDLPKQWRHAQGPGCLPRPSTPDARMPSDTSDTSDTDTSAR